MMKFYSPLLFLLLFVFGHNASAQETVNLKFGKPTQEEMEMTSYKSDNAADAVVLCRLTNVVYNVQVNGYLVDYHEKIRIKVLKPEGARYATFTIPYSKLPIGKVGIGVSKFSLKTSAIEMGTNKFKFDSSSTSDYFENANGGMTESALGNYTDESVEDLKATAFNLVNGKVVKSRLKNSEVVRKQLDDVNWQASFTVPDVKEGTVIECEYCLHSEQFYRLHDWYAQREIPVAYAHLDLEIPSYLIFNIEEHGLQRLDYQCVQGTMRYKLESDAIAAPVSISTNHITCEGRDLKAMPKDDYVWNEKDYCAGITGELKSYSLRGTMPIAYAKTWEQIDNMILNDEDLGKCLGDTSPLADELKAAQVASITDEMARAATVYKLVMSRVRWNGNYALWPEKTSETLKKGEGNNADINMLLIQSLNQVGLNASPVLLRNRDQGLMPYNFPSISKLTTYVVGITLSNGSNVFVDASSLDGYLNVLPASLQVERARLVKKDRKGRIVNLQKLQKSQTSTVIDAVLSPSGTLTGKQTTRYSGLAAANYRQQLRAQGKAVEFAPDATEVVEFTTQGDVSDGRISICPFPHPPITANPFTAESRLMPVEFPTLQSEQIIVNITLPEGYVWEGEPRQTIVTTPDKGIDGRLYSATFDGKVQLQYQFNVNQIAHSEKNYADLRQIFEMFREFVNERIVVKKK